MILVVCNISLVAWRMYVEAYSIEAQRMAACVGKYLIIPLTLLLIFVYF